MIIVNNLKFNGRKGVKLYLKNMLYKYNINDNLSEDDLLFFISLMNETEHGRNKIGVGILKVVIEKGLYGNRGFTIYRIDGSKDDISYIKITLFTDKQRHSIYKHQLINAFRHLTYSKPKIKGNQLHHEGKSFSNIFSDFLNTYSLTIDDIELTDCNKRHGIKFIKDPIIAKNFIKFHNKYAQLIEVTPEEHRAIHSVTCKIEV
jgi:hypothetical protein